MPRVFLVALAFLAPALSGCLGAEVDPGSGLDPGTLHTENAEEADIVQAFEGSLTATPATPAAEDFTFEVPKGATAVSVTLIWSGNPGSSLQLHLLDPRGEPAGRGFPESAGRASLATVDPPRSGEWTVRVASSRALDEAFTVNVTVTFLVPLDNTLSDTVEMQAGGFVELNLIMEGDASFTWEFEADGGSVDWNVHSHENGQTEYHERGSGESHKGNFTAPKRQIYSIMFESLSPSPIELSYVVEGAFRPHSHTQ